VANLSDMIALGRIDMAMAGGMENFSDIPIRLSQNVRRSAMKLRQSRSTKDKLKVLGKLRLSDLALDIPASEDFTTRKTMGALTEAMVQKFHVSREDCDRFALQSHQRATQAIAAGNFKPDIAPVQINGHAAIDTDNSPRAGISMEKLAGLKPAFDKDEGVITAGNASRFTDGAAALLLGSLGAAEKQGLEPMAVVKDYVFTGVDDLHTEMLLGPAMAIPRLLGKNKLSMDDIDVWEVHEAFAAQLLVNQVCLASDAFCKERFGLKQALGAMPEDKLNIWGGSLALGNPFAATGGRLLMTAARRLQETGQRYAVVSSCAGGGLGTAILLENPNLT
ncbi:MAG: thiolase family protein, partial [Nevskiales bacterium]